MTVEILPSFLSGKLTAPDSKSELHRYLFASALAAENAEPIYCKTASVLDAIDDPELKKEVSRFAFSSLIKDECLSFEINNISNDILETVSALNSAGADIRFVGEKCHIVKSSFCKKADIEIKESGTTLRFILPILAAKGINANIRLSERLSERPLKPLSDALCKNGAIIRNDGNGTLTVKGRLKSGNYSLPGNISSQFISGLLFALPLLDGDSTVTLTSEAQSYGYIGLTVDILARFGITITKTENGYIIPGNQKYIMPEIISIGGDWSNSAPFLCMGALNGNIEISGLDDNSTQSDKRITDILSLFGAETSFDKNTIKVSEAGKLKAVTFNSEDNPDLVPVIAALASFADGETVISGVSRLKFKESDRIKTISETLISLGADVTYNDNEIHIIGKNELCGGKCQSYNDHRIVMLAAIIGCNSKNGVIIENAEAINKSYPSFFNELKSLGGKVNVIDNGQ